MICGKCGANLPDGSQFCTVCGNSLEANPSATPVQTTYYAPAAASSGISIFGVILMIVGAVLAVSWLAYFVYNLIVNGQYLTDIWATANSFLTNICIGVGIMGLGAVLNKLAKK